MKRAAALLVLFAASCRREAPHVQADPAPSVPAPKANAPRVIASGQRHPWNVVVDATHVYWANKGEKNDGHVARMPKGGGAIEELGRLGRDTTPYGLAVRDGIVHWGNARPTAGAIVSQDRSIAIAMRIQRPSDVWSIVATEQRLFWTELTGHAVASVPMGWSGAPPAIRNPKAYPADEVTPTIHATTAGRPVGLAVDDAYVYWTDSDPGVVARTPIAGGPITNLVTGGDKTTGLAVDDAWVYWSEWGSGRIGKIRKEGGPIVTLATDQKGARAIAVDEHRVYWTHPPSGSVRSVAKAGGEVFTHATGQKHPYSVTVDATSIYWANVDGDTVMAVDK